MKNDENNVVSLRKKALERLEDRCLAKQGTQCPVCMNETPETSIPDVTESGVYMDVYCSNCDTSWQNVYSLTGIQSVESPTLP